MLTLRIRFLPWLSKNLNQKIEFYEQALRKIGSLRKISSMTEDSDTHSNYIQQMYDIFMEFIGAHEDAPKEPVHAANAVLEHLRDILNIYDLEMLRRRAVKLATRKIS